MKTRLILNQSDLKRNVHRTKQSEKKENKMDAIDFTDKVVIVTGASSGIGAEAAKIFAEFGAKLTIVGRNEARLNNVAMICHLKNNLVPLKVLVDLTHAGSCEAVIEKTVETYGRIDVLVNCAGKLKLTSVFDRSMESFDELIAINLRVPYFLVQLATPHLIKTKGNVVNIGSSMAKRYKPGVLVYSVTKSALERLTKSAAPELATEGVRINTISPGMTRTNILENLDISGSKHQQEAYDNIVNMLPNGRIIEPREIAMFICLTASNAFPSANGSNFIVDGAACLS